MRGLDDENYHPAADLFCLNFPKLDDFLLASKFGRLKSGELFGGIADNFKAKFE